MTALEGLGLAFLRRIDPEVAHDLALKALRTGILPLSGPVSLPRLSTNLAGLNLPNPVGLAAGFDKNAVAIPQLMKAGFGFIEVGGVTPRPQSGNPKPRLFRLPEDRGVINRFGFNNDGMAEISARLAKRPQGIPVGVNLGANKDSTDRAEDYAKVLAACGPYVDFAVVNVSSPNTEKLRDLQGPAALAALLAGVMEARANLGRNIPVFLKIAPDLEEADLAALVETALTSGISGIVCTNTTLARDGLKSAARKETGGLSGQPLFERSTRILARVSELTEGRLPLIGVGGIGSGQQAYDKIRAGASALQLYSALALEGLSLARRIAHELDALLERDGCAHVSEAVGTDRARWLA